VTSDRTLPSLFDRNRSLFDGGIDRGRLGIGDGSDLPIRSGEGEPIPRSSFFQDEFDLSPRASRESQVASAHRMIIFPRTRTRTRGRDAPLSLERDRWFGPGRSGRKGGWSGGISMWMRIRMRIEIEGGRGRGRGRSRLG
jgi:hypothetical protein